jgi:proline iminopeptidase
MTPVFGIFKGLQKNFQRCEQKLGLDTIHLFAHSWGTMLAAEYISTNPKGIKSIIFSGLIFSTTQHLENVNQVKLNFPSHKKTPCYFMKKMGQYFPRHIQKHIMNI